MEENKVIPSDTEIENELNCLDKKEYDMKLSYKSILKNFMKKDRRLDLIEFLEVEFPTEFNILIEKNKTEIDWKEIVTNFKYIHNLYRDFYSIICDNLLLSDNEYRESLFYTLVSYGNNEILDLYKDFILNTIIEFREKEKNEYFENNFLNRIFLKIEKFNFYFLEFLNVNGFNKNNEIYSAILTRLYLNKDSIKLHSKILKTYFDTPDNFRKIIDLFCENDDIINIEICNDYIKHYKEYLMTDDIEYNSLIKMNKFSKEYNNLQSCRNSEIYQTQISIFPLRYSILKKISKIIMNFKIPSEVIEDYVNFILDNFTIYNEKENRGEFLDKTVSVLIDLIYYQDIGMTIFDKIHSKIINYMNINNLEYNDIFYSLIGKLHQYQEAIYSGLYMTTEKVEELVPFYNQLKIRTNSACNDKFNHVINQLKYTRENYNTDIKEIEINMANIFTLEYYYKNKYKDFESKVNKSISYNKENLKTLLK